MILALLLACTSTPPIYTAPEAMRGRFTSQWNSSALKTVATVEGALITGGGRARLDLRDASGGALASIVASGRGLDVVLPGARRHLIAPHAEPVIRSLTHDAAGLDDLIALVVASRPDTVRPGSAGTRIRSGRASNLLLTVNDDGTPSTVSAVRDDGKVALVARYDAWHEVDGTLRPEGLHMHWDALDLGIDLKWTSWEVLESTPIIKPVRLDNAKVEALEDATRALLKKMDARR